MQELVEKFDAVPNNSTPEEAASVLFPQDEAARAEYVQKAAELEREYDNAKAEARTSGEPMPRVLPVFVAAALPIIARCVAGALTSALFSRNWSIWSTPENKMMQLPVSRTLLRVASAESFPGYG